MPGPGISSATAACLLACVLLLQAALFPAPALADRADSGHAAASGGADRTGHSFFPAEETVSKTYPGAGLLAMGGKSRDHGATTTRSGPAETGEGAAASVSRPALEGGFLGALLFGYPFEDFNILDLVLLVLLGFLLVWRFMPDPRSKKKPEDGSGAGLRDASSAKRPAGLRLEKPGGAAGKDPGSLAAQGSAGEPGSRKDGLSAREAENAPAGPVRPPFRRRSETSGGQGGVRRYTGAAAPGSADVPGTSSAGSFDPDDFLEGARVLYIRMQEAWAERDTESLAPFMTPDMMSLLRERAAADPHPVSMHIMLLDAALAGLERQNGEERAGVKFSVLMSTDRNAPVRVHEIWHFVRGGDADATWRLADIEEHEEGQ